MMDRVDFANKQFTFCIPFLTVCNKGKGQNIKIRINDKNIIKVLGPEDIYINKFVDSVSWSYWYENYKKLIKNAIEKTMMRLQTNYGFGWGDWGGQNRNEEIDIWESRLEKTLKYYRFLNDIKIDPEVFNYIVRYSMDLDEKFSIVFAQNSPKYCPDLQKLVKFLELIGYECKKTIQYPTSYIYFDELEADKLDENKLIWDFI